MRLSGVCLPVALFVLGLAACGGGGGGGSGAVGTAVLRTCGQEGGPLRILPLGDSITEGETGHDSYRRALWFHLGEAGCDVDFVGSRRGVSTGRRDSPQVDPPNPDFDLDHEGHWDFRADELAALVGGWARRAAPHVVLVHAGTNDIFQGQSAASTIDDLEAVIDAIRGSRPKVAILLAKVIPSTRSSADLADLNGRIDGLAAAKTRPDSPVVVVDQAAGYSTGDNYDGIHPAPLGESKMADKWANALLALAAGS